MSEHAALHEPVWHTSVYPFILSVGILFLLPLSFVFHFVYGQTLTAIISLGIGAPLTIIGIAGWVKEGLKDEHHYGEGLSVWAMPIFIVAEAFLFIGFFIAYWVLRLNSTSWPPVGTPEHMPVAIPIIMTIILISSSITMHFAEGKIEKDDKAGFLSWLIITMILGAVFLSLSMYEWTELISEGFGVKTNVYSTVFYSITGFHGSHVLVGLGMFIAILLPAIAMNNINKAFVRSASIYWHFVDIIWLFVVSQIYFW